MIGKYETCCVVQGTLMKHLEEHILQSDMMRDDVMLYYTTVGFAVHVSQLAVELGTRSLFVFHTA